MCYILNISFLKEMSDSPDDFKIMDEAEWRIVYTDRAYEEGRLRKTELEQPKSKIPFTQRELRILVLPDEETRMLALDDPYIKEWLLEDSTSLPIIITAEECLHF